MKLFQKAVLLASLALIPTMSQASVVMNFYGGIFTDNGQPLPSNSTIVVLADADNDGSFGDLTQAISSFTADSGDRVLARFGTNNWGDAEFGTVSVVLGEGTTAFPTITYGSGIAAGEKLLVVWYDKPFTASDVGPGTGVHFGTWRSDVATNNGIACVLPADGGSYDLNLTTSDNSGSLSPSLFVANLVTAAAPEPASLAVLAVGGLALLARRRRA
jgi:hypothetical protein